MSKHLPPKPKKKKPGKKKRLRNPRGRRLQEERIIGKN